MINRQKIKNQTYSSQFFNEEFRDIKHGSRYTDLILLVFHQEKNPGHLNHHPSKLKHLNEKHIKSYLYHK